MKIRLEHNGMALDIEREPVPLERFRALCKLAGAAIGGVVLVALVHMVGVWAVAWAVGALVAVGLYKVFENLLKGV